MDKSIPYFYYSSMAKRQKALATFSRSEAAMLVGHPRDALAYRLHCDGLSYTKIGQRLGISSQRAKQLCERHEYVLRQQKRELTSLFGWLTALLPKLSPHWDPATGAWR